MKSFYVTTPIFYANDLPHVGTSYTVFIADTLARYFRKKIGAENVLFLTGTDEHGAKVEKSALARGTTPKQFVDEIAAKFQEIWSEVGISYDYFMRTTHPQHVKYAQWFIQKAYDNGDLYEGVYKGLYCEGCEAYCKDTDLIDGKCPNHPKKTLVLMEEKNYFFRLSKYRSRILSYIKKHPEFIRPQKWYDYIINELQKDLEDIPVTRANVSWGIRVPFASNQTIYVWYDALPNYISYLNFPENEARKFQDKYWTEAVHVVGKDILKFHAILWPAMLMSVGIPLPKTILVNGFFTVNGVKIGKSNQNVISPVDLAKKYGVDALRYAILTEFQIGNDGDFSYERLEGKYNGELADNFGNLLNRVIHLMNKKEMKINQISQVENSFKNKVDGFISKFDNHMSMFEIKEACDSVSELFSFGNKYLDDTKPWKSTDDEKDFKVLSNLYYLLSCGVEAFDCIIPSSAKIAKSALNSLQPIILFKKV